MPRLARWLTLDRGYLSPLRRFVGVLMLFIAPEVFFWSHGGPGPYLVPAWWVGATPIALPVPPPALDALAWLAYGMAALALIIGNQGRVMPAIGAAVLAYYGSSDLMACNSSYTIMVFVYLLALLFDRAPRGCARRLIQIGVTTCYAYSALHKTIHPDWILGHTLSDIVHQGTYFRSSWTPLLRSLPRCEGFYRATSIGVVAAESLLAVGLWLAPMRRLAVMGGLWLHMAFLLTLTDIEFFAPTMMAGLLAFLESRTSLEGSDSVPTSREAVLAGLVVLVLVAMPARLYLLPGQTSGSLSFFDRSPWSFSMYLFVQDVESVKATYVGSDGKRRDVPLTGRMDRAGSDKELRSLAFYILQTHPSALAVEVRSRIRINHRRTREQAVKLERPGSRPDPR